MATEPAVLLGITSDGATPNDTLGFASYVDSVAKFLESPNTQPPLTLSIEGEWGSGKSSFMLQLKNKLCEMREDRIAVEFNAWRHDKDDSLWAAFALKCARDLRESLPLRQQLTGWLWLNRARLDGFRGWTHLARLAAIALLWLCLFIAGPTLIIWKGADWTRQALLRLQSPPPHSAASTSKNAYTALITSIPVWLVVNGGTFGIWAVTLILGGSLLKKLGNPLETDLEKIVSTPGYEGRVEFIDQFHDDFRKILDAYVGNRRVYVFVDDLDRCDVPKAADLMRALNLMIDDDKRMVFILGMDREKVAAGITAKYSTILQYIGDSQDGPSADKLAFGYNFLEKFIQIQYRLPQPRLTNIRALVGVPLALATSISGVPASDQSGDSPGAISRSGDIQDLQSSKTSAAVSIDRRAIEVLLDRDGDAVYTVVEMVAPVFNFNPRRIKQFLNLFRLSVFISNGLGLFDWIQDQPVMTFEQLAKFVTISMVWPSFIQLLESDQALLQNLYKSWLTTTPGGETSWLKVDRFRYLISYGIRKADGTQAPDAATFSVEHLDTASLLAVTAPIIRSTSKAPDTPSSPSNMSRVDAAGEAAAAAESPGFSSRAAPDNLSVPLERQLEDLARRYENTRISMKASDERTAAMSAIVRRSRNLANQVQDPLIPVKLFEQGADGDRVVGLGLAQGLSPNADFIPLAVEGIARSKSAFEQFQALTLAAQLIDVAPTTKRPEIYSALMEQQGVPIDQTDPSRWQLREKLLSLFALPQG